VLLRGEGGKRKVNVEAAAFVAARLFASHRVGPCAPAANAGAVRT
jgi:hypothetical protein